MEAQNRNMNETENGNEEVKNESKKREKFNIRLVKPADFDACAQTRMTTIKDLSVQINAPMMTAYNDYIGCNLVCAPTPNGAPAIAPYFYFRILPEEMYGQKGVITAFKPVMVKNDNILEKLKIMSLPSSTTGKMVEMTKEGKEGLSDIMYMPSNNVNDDWWKKQFTMRPNIGTGQGQETYVCFGGFIINNDMLMRKVFGYTDEDGSSVEYQVIPIRPLADPNAATQGQIVNWALNITRLSREPLDRSAETFGMVTTTYNAVPMVRAIRPGY